MKAWAVVAGLVLLSALLGYGAHVVRKASRVDAAEARAAAAEAGRAADMAEVVKRLDAAAARAAEDRKADESLTSRLTALEGAAADLRRAAARIPATVEKSDAQGVPRAVINPDWWLCRSAILSGDTGDAEACAARAGDGAVRPGIRPPRL